MQNTTSVELSRDCEAVQIPAGHKVVLPKGTPVEITQTLGGSFTVMASGSLFRLANGDADALGIEAPAPGAANANANAASEASGPADESAIWETLRTCYDPEIPVNIVDLGLVYDLHLEPQPSGRSKVFVKMTLTAPGCGMGTVIAADAQQKLLELPGVEDASVEIVWDPPWHHSMISPAGRARLGLD
ncbi:MAG: putative Fe-S cluster assembly protein SufT [Verrucomicrobia bacterium]|nr:putative Fe-S cluster assembly protein SufT [Verrucomicrobiota bacterium]